MRRSSFLLLAFFALTCSSLDPNRTKSPFYKDGRFFNLDPSDGLLDKGFLTFLKWKFFGPADPPRVADAPDTPPIVRKIRAEDLLAPQGMVRITWIGHATTWISANKNGKVMSIITDPIFGSPLILKRQTEMPIAPEDLPPVDVVVVSHAHYDHCDSETLAYLQKRSPNAVFYFPEGMASWARDYGLVGHRSARWWEKEKLGLGTLRVLPSQHWSNRGIFDHMQYHWASYLWEIEGLKIYFAGDTGFSLHFQRSAEAIEGPVDAAILPIGSYAPRWFMKPAHIDPAEAVTAAKILKAHVILPIHWATFRLSDEKIMEPILSLKEEAAKEKIEAAYWTPGGHVDIPMKSP